MNRHPSWYDRCMRTAALIELGWLLAAWENGEAMNRMVRAVKATARSHSTRALHKTCTAVESHFGEDDPDLRQIVQADLDVLRRMAPLPEKAG